MSYYTSYFHLVTIVSFRKRIIVTYNIKQFTRCIFYWFWKIASWIKYTLHLPFCTSCKVVAGVKLWNHYKRQLVWRHDLSLNLHTHTHTQTYLCKPTRTRSKSPMLISLCTTMLIHLLWDRSNSIYRSADLLRQFNGNANLCKCNFISSLNKNLKNLSVISTFELFLFPFLTNFSNSFFLSIL